VRQRLAPDRVWQLSRGSRAPEIQVRGRPAHAGRLRRSERCVFVGVFAVMAVLVVGITMSVVKPAARTAGGLAASSEAVPAGGGSASSPVPHADGNHAGGNHGASGLPQSGLNARLTAALRPAAALCPGALSVAVRDRSTGAEALSAAGQVYPAVSTVAPDILAVLEYHHQQSVAPISSALEPGAALTRPEPGTPLSGSLLNLAARMIDYGGRAPTAALWRLIGGARGFDAGAVALHLQHTVTGPAGGWRHVSTTAADQLQLLVDLTSAGSPLAPATRAADLALMARAVAGSRTWAAASPRTGFASGGWHAGLTTSMAIVRHGGQKLIVAVLSRGCATRAAGMAVAEAAARAAAAMIAAAAPASRPAAAGMRA
jgi:hypothetical protein